MTRKPKNFNFFAEQGSGTLEEAIEKYYLEILRYCFWHVPDPSLAEDAAQETFLKAVQYLDRYRSMGKFRAFLYKIAANTCIDMCRKKQAEPLSEEAAYQERGFSRIEEELDFWKSIQMLPKPTKELVFLRFAQNLKLREIAQITGLPLRTVQSRLRQALKQIKKEWEKEYEK